MVSGTGVKSAGVVLALPLNDIDHLENIHTISLTLGDGINKLTAISK